MPSNFVYKNTVFLNKHLQIFFLIFFLLKHINLSATMQPKKAVQQSTAFRKSRLDADKLYEQL